jgi:hypothetical protein
MQFKCEIIPEAISNGRNIETTTIGGIYSDQLI